jgi:hypothetical protein
MMNSFIDLTDMWKTGTLKPLRVCSSGKCWDDANASGFLSPHQKEAGRAESGST